MRIIGGNLRGKQINLPTNYKARPTTDFAKEGLFNTISNEFDLESCRILDLFSGTGSISYEFASRGCPEIYSIEMSPINAKYIKNTSSVMGIGSIQVVRHNVFDFLDICKLDFDIIFADPPYEIAMLDSIPDKVFRSVSDNSKVPLLRENGLFILEHPINYSFVSHPHFIKEKKYGNVHFSFFR